MQEKSKEPLKKVYTKTSKELGKKVRKKGTCRRSNYASLEKYLFCLGNATFEIGLAKLRRNIYKMTHD